jgi:hypothetical protein
MVLRPVLVPGRVAAQEAGDRADPVGGLPQPVHQRQQVVGDGAQGVRHGLDDRVVQHPPYALEPGAQRPHRLLELLDQVLEPFGGPLRRRDGLGRHPRGGDQLADGGVEVGHRPWQLRERLGLLLQDVDQLGQPRDAGEAEAAEGIHVPTVGDPGRRRNRQSAGRVTGP